MSTGERRDHTEEELRAAYEAQVKQLRVDDVLLETVVTLVNLGMRRTGLTPGTEDERDAGQVRTAIESIRALMPVVEQTTPEQAGPIRDALSQLQLAFVRIGGSEAGGEPAGSPSAGGSGAPGAGGSGTPGAGGSGTPGAGPAGEPQPSSTPQRDEPGPAQRSGRLWVPGQ